MFEIPSLPYKYAALEPFIDEETMRVHHTKHHQAYVDKLNAAIEKYPNLGNKTLEELLSKIEDLPEDIRLAVKNHGGGHWNHMFFWEIMGKAATENNPPDGLIAAEFEDQFGTYENFKQAFKEKALGVFGSGWVWVSLEPENKLEIYSTPNQDSPAMTGKKVILGLDVWEHAYYLKYQNRRAEYIDGFMQVINWKKVNELLKS